MNIATIITCFNRKDKTVRCLRHLFAAADAYNALSTTADKISLAIFLTDDGCTDGTADAVKEICVGRELHIVQGDGHCYWAGGMRLAWVEALRQQDKWDFYALVNDDTYVYADAFTTLLNAHRYCLQTYGKAGIYSGITCDPADHNRITYGGYVWTNFWLGRDRILEPVGTPQMCDKANCNVMLLDRSVVDGQGIFWDGYEHGAADYDYSMQARKRGYPVVVTGAVCGECEYDHHSEENLKARILSMNYEQRKAYFNNPLHSSKDVLRFKRRNTPVRYWLGWIGRELNLRCPQFYYALSDLRLK